MTRSPESGPSDGRRLALTATLALWVLAFAMAFVAGDIRGEPDASAYLGWQAIAGLLAIAAFGLARPWPQGSTVRRLTRLPLVVAALHVVAAFWLR